MTNTPAPIILPHVPPFEDTLLERRLPHYLQRERTAGGIFTDDHDRRKFIHGGMNGREIWEMPGVDYGTVSISRKRFSDKTGHDRKFGSRFRQREDVLHIQG